MGETSKLASFVAASTFDDIPEDSVRRTKQAIRDYLGVALFGSHHEVGEKIHTYTKTSQSGDAATVIGHGTASSTGAALDNGTFGHAVDYDDTFESIVIHPTSPVCGASMSAAEIANASGQTFLTGYAVGVETAYRVGHSTYPGHYKNGWHSTGTIGSIGAATASASILDLDKDEIQHALGIVSSSSSSLKKNFGTMTKPLHAGHAAEMGLRAALLAQEGFTADSNVLEGELGYGNVMTPIGEYTPDDIVDELGEVWNITDIGFKPYPSGVITHGAMEAMRTIVQNNMLTSDDVYQVRVSLDEAASEMLIHADPDDALQAKFSIEFCLAAVLREGDAGIHQFTDEYVQQEETKAVSELVEREFEPNLFDGDYAGYGARVIVETVNGDEYQEEVKYAPGSPSNPISDERLEEKFFECAETVLSHEDATTIIDTIETIDEPGEFDRLCKILRNV